MKKFLFYLIQWTYGIIQNLLGLIVFLFFIFKKHHIYRCSVITVWNFKNSLSLGMFIFSNDINNLYIIKHEYGHSIQSLILGPFWLLIIGIPSILWCSLFSLRIIKNIDYYSFYSERWANKLTYNSLKD